MLTITFLAILIILNISILSSVHFLIKKIKQMGQELDALTAQVDTNTSVEESAVQLLTNLKTELDAAIAANGQGDGTALTALSAKLGTSAGDLAAAITKNTPAAPAAS